MVGVGEVRRAAPVSTRASGFQHLQIFTVRRGRLSTKGCRFKHQNGQSRGLLTPLPDDRKDGQQRRQWGRGESGIINYSVCETS